MKLPCDMDRCRSACQCTTFNAVLRQNSLCLEQMFTYTGSTLYFWLRHDLGEKYHAPQVRPDRGVSSWSPDHAYDSSFHVNETSALTTHPSVTSMSFHYT